MMIFILSSEFDLGWVVSIGLAQIQAVFMMRVGRKLL